MPKAAAKLGSSKGHHFGKLDMKRIGFYVEMDYMNGKGYMLFSFEQ
jgi:hypothetical protein